MAKVISEKEYDDLIAKLLVEGLNEEERVQVDEYQKALIDGKAKKSSPTEKRKDLYKNELKRRMGKNYDKKVLNAEDPRYAEGLTKSPNGKLKMGDIVYGDMPGEVGKIVNITADWIRVRDNSGELHDFDEDDLMLHEKKESTNPKKEKLKSKIKRMKERYSLKEQVTPAFQKELFRILRNHYPNATASDMEKVIKFIDRNCGKQNY